MKFFNSLIFKLISSLNNDHKDNWETGRYGPEAKSQTSNSFINKLGIINSRGYYHVEQIYHVLELLESTELYDFQEELERSYSLLEDDQSRILYVELIAYRILGHRKVRISAVEEKIKAYRKEVEKYIDLNNCIKSNWGNRDLYLHNFKYLNETLSLYLTKGGPLNAFFLKQYHCEVDENLNIGPEKGDVVLDCGGCWGDTTFEFATSVGPEGKVYVYEFIPFNNAVINKNIERNPNIADRIEVIDNAVWSESGMNVYYVDNGPGSRVEFKPFSKMEGNAKTLSIDNLVQSQSIKKVSLIKMDIEGAEQAALKGALGTIAEFKPKLAISIYHSLSDFASITTWINSLELGYKFYVRHFTIHQEETVLFAAPA